MTTLSEQDVQWVRMRAPSSTPGHRDGLATSCFISPWLPCVGRWGEHFLWLRAWEVGLSLLPSLCLCASTCVLAVT